MGGICVSEIRAAGNQPIPGQSRNPPVKLRFAFFNTWMRSESGSAFDNLSGASAREETAMIQASGIDHIVLHRNDVARAKKFYTEILSMTVHRENDTQVFLHAGGEGKALFKKQVGRR
jgi:hypothetical protein